MCHSILCVVVVVSFIFELILKYLILLGRVANLRDTPLVREDSIAFFIPVSYACAHQIWAFFIRASYVQYFKHTQHTTRQFSPFASSTFFVLGCIFSRCSLKLLGFSLSIFLCISDSVLCNTFSYVAFALQKYDYISTSSTIYQNINWTVIFTLFGRGFLHQIMLTCTHTHTHTPQDLESVVRLQSNHSICFYP